MGQFVIEEPGTQDNADLLVVGRCWSKVDRNETFRYLTFYENKVLNDELVAQYQSPMLVDLKVVEILAYRRSLDELDQGYTGTLLLRGDASMIAGKISLGHYAVLSDLPLADAPLAHST